MSHRRHCGLWRRGAVYQYRVRVPVDLIDRIGRTHINRSLKTASFTVATRLVRKVAFEIETYFDQAPVIEGGTVLPTVEPQTERIVSPIVPDIAPSVPAALTLAEVSERYLNDPTSARTAKSEMIYRTTYATILGIVGPDASYANSHYDNATVPCRDSNGDGVPDTAGQPAVPVGQQVAFCTTNDRLANIPRFALSANSELRFSAGSVEPFIRGLLTYRPGFYAQTANYRYNAITNVNLFAGIRSADAGWELTAFVKNLFNSTQITNATTAELQIATRFLVPGPAGNPTPFRSGYTNLSVNPPREFGITMNYRF